MNITRNAVEVVANDVKQVLNKFPGSEENFSKNTKPEILKQLPNTMDAAATKLNTYNKELKEPKAPEVTANRGNRR